MVDSGDDTRKKRECPPTGQEPSGDTPAPEKCKKFRRVKNSRHADSVCVDIETAMHRILHPEREPLSDGMYVTFRAGHAGDAPAIEALYHGGENADTYSTEQHKEESASSLELWLSEGMGDEDTPPFVFSILAEISSDDQPSNTHLAAVALLTVAWEANQRMLRVEWCHVDDSVLARRMWLRLSALAVMTGACLCITEDCPNFGIIANDGR